MSHYILSDVINDSMNLNNCVTQLDKSTNFYVIRIGDIPLHTTINDGCNISTIPNIFSDTTETYYPSEIAGIYLFTNLDDQLLLTYGKYYGSRLWAHKYGNVSEIILKDEISHILENNLSSIVAHSIDSDSYLIDMTDNHNLDEIVIKLSEMQKDCSSATYILPQCLTALNKQYQSTYDCIQYLIDSFMAFTNCGTNSYFLSDIKSGSDISIPQVPRTEHSELKKRVPRNVTDAYQSLRDYNDKQVLQTYRDRDTFENDLQTKIAAKYDAVKRDVSDFINREMVNETDINNLLTSSKYTVVNFDKSVTSYDKTQIIRFEGTNGSIILFVPITDGYRVHTKFIIDHVDNNSSCGLCNITTTDTTIFSPKYKLGVTSMSKYFAPINGVLEQTALAVENINGQSYYLSSLADGEERILSFPYSHSATWQPCQLPQDLEHDAQTCGLHTYYTNVPFAINDRMLFDMISTLNVTLTYVSQKYSTEFTIGPINYEDQDGISYKFVDTNVPTIYPIFHICGNSVSHLHLHTWLCVDGKKMSKTLNMDTTGITHVNISETCSANVFGDKSYSVINGQIVSPNYPPNPDPFYGGGSFEYAFKKMLGISSGHALMKCKLTFDKPAYNLHKDCYVDEKQQYHTLNMTLLRKVNKTDYTTHTDYSVISRSISNINYSFPQAISSNTTKRVNLGKQTRHYPHYKGLMNLIIKTITPLNSNIAGYFTRAQPIFKAQLKDVAYINHPEVFVISPIDSNTRIVTNSAYTTCNKIISDLFVTQLVEMIFTYHKLYSITVTERIVNIGTLWERICSDIASAVSDEDKVEQLSRVFGPLVTTSVTNVFHNHRHVGGVSGTLVSNAKQLTTQTSHKQHMYPNIQNYTKLKLINNKRHQALSLLSEKDIEIFVKKHNNIFNHDDDVLIVIDDENILTVNASKLRVNDVVFTPKMKALLLYHKIM